MRMLFHCWCVALDVTLAHGAGHGHQHKNDDSAKLRAPIEFFSANLSSQANDALLCSFGGANDHADDVRGEERNPISKFLLHEHSYSVSIIYI